MKDFIGLLGKTKPEKLSDPVNLPWLNKNLLKQGKIFKPAHSLELRAVVSDTVTLEGQCHEQAQITSPGAVQPEGKSVLKSVPRICMPIPKSLAQREKDDL